MLTWWLLSCKSPTAAVDHRVTVPIAAINDYHSALAERPLDGGKSAAGGLPWFAAAIDALRAEHPDLVLLDGGDTFQGDPAMNATRGLGAAQVFDLLKVDAGAVGNHEFDYGGVDGAHPLRGALEAAAAVRHAPFVSANIQNADGSPYQPPGVVPWTMIERHGVQLGVIGLTTTETPQTTLLKHVADLRFADPVTTVASLAPQLRARGADAIIVAGHLTGGCKPPGFAEPDLACRPDGEIGRLLTDLPRGTIDVIVAGHAHTLIAQRIDDTFVVEGRSHGQIINTLDLVFGPKGLDRDASRVNAPWALTHAPTDPGCTGAAFPTTPLPVGERTLTPSAAAIALQSSLIAAGPNLCAPVGCTNAPLTRAREAESALGDVVADAMLTAFPGADGAITNSGGLRADLPAGTVRKSDVQAVMPFENRLVMVDIDGAHLSTLLRIGTSGAHGLVQVSEGLRLQIDPSATAGSDLDGNSAIDDWERDRTCAMTVGGTPIDPNRHYRLVTSDFLFGGGDHLGPAFAGASVIAEGPLLRDAIGDAIGHTKACIDAPPASRITVAPGCAAR